MDAKVRRTLIEERVAAEGEIEITPLASEFNVSEMTIRRDIEVLETQGLVRKVIHSRRGRSWPSTRRRISPRPPSAC
jgi:DeoR/GlpR family transcriptional regulator of sugar metabolism